MITITIILSCISCKTKFCYSFDQTKKLSLVKSAPYPAEEWPGKGDNPLHDTQSGIDADHS